MTVTLFKGNFKAAEALDMLTQMIHIKVKYHESKIDKSSNEEDMKMRERRIKELQKDLFEIRRYIEQKNKSIEVEAAIEIH
jgi:hypothetical protein